MHKKTGIDFRKLMTPEGRVQSDFIDDFRKEAWEMSNSQLGLFLLGLTKTLQAELASHGWHRDSGVYDSHMAWGCLPQIVSALGVDKKTIVDQVGEFQMLANTAQDLADLRAETLSCLHQMSGVQKNVLLALLLAKSVNGNPIVFALDRLSPPAPGEDHVKRLAEAAYHRQVDFNKEDGRWTPEVFAPQWAEETNEPLAHLNMVALPGPQEDSERGPFSGLRAEKKPPVFVPEAGGLDVTVKEIFCVTYRNEKGLPVHGGLFGVTDDGIISLALVDHANEINTAKDPAHVFLGILFLSDKLRFTQQGVTEAVHCKNIVDITAGQEEFAKSFERELVRQTYLRRVLPFTDFAPSAPATEVAYGREEGAAPGM